jgi:hypothetical protein
MNILLWYLPFAMFSETCDLMIAECKAPAQGKRTRCARGGRRSILPRGSAEGLWHNWRRRGVAVTPCVRNVAGAAGNAADAGEP